MQNVSNQSNLLKIVSSLVLFAIFAVFVSPQAVLANTVTYSLPSVTSDSKYTASRSYHYVIEYSSYSSAVQRSYSYDLSSVQSSNDDAAAGVVEPQTPVQSSPQVSQATLAAGTKYATDLYIIESGKPGPVVMIVGGVHGNEPAGFTAANQVKNWQITKGTLLVLPNANQRADDRNVRYISGEGDLNRMFPTSSSDSPDNTLSKAIWKAVKDYDVEWLMDMHEGYDYYKNTSTDSVGQSLIYYPNSTTSAVASKIVSTLNKGITNTYKHFSLLRYPIKGSLARSAAQYQGVHAFIFETCNNPSLSVRVNYQLKAAKTLLSELDMM